MEQSAHIFYSSGTGLVDANLAVLGYWMRDQFVSGL